MTREEAKAITDFEKCEFSEIHQHYKARSEERKAMSKEEKAQLKAENEKILEEYGWAIIDGHRWGLEGEVSFPGWAGNETRA